MNNGFIVLDTIKNNKFYDGTTLKFGITVDNVDYIIGYKTEYWNYINRLFFWNRRFYFEL